MANDQIYNKGVKDSQKNKAVRYKMLLERITDTKKKNPDMSNVTLSQLFGIDRSMIGRILNGKHPKYYYDYYKIDKENPPL
jgi:hypothetical protein